MNHNTCNCPENQKQQVNDVSRETTLGNQSQSTDVTAQNEQSMTDDKPVNHTRAEPTTQQGEQTEHIQIGRKTLPITSARMQEYCKRAQDTLTGEMNKVPMTAVGHTLENVLAQREELCSTHTVALHLS